MIERLKFVQDALSDRFTMADVCARYGVSHTTGLKWIARCAEEGRRGLADRSRAPLRVRTCSRHPRPNCSCPSESRIRSGTPASC